MIPIVTTRLLLRHGVPVNYQNAQGQLRHAQARVIDFQSEADNRFLAVREMEFTGLRARGYNRGADWVCFVNGLPLVFIELKAVYKNIRAGFDGKWRDYLNPQVIGHVFHHNAFLIVSNGHRARYGSITSQWEHFAEWKRLEEQDKDSVEARVLLDRMLAKKRLLDLVENLSYSTRAGRRNPQGAGRESVGGAVHPELGKLRGILAYAGEREIALDGVLCGEGEAMDIGKVYVSGDDGLRGPGRCQSRFA